MHGWCSRSCEDGFPRLQIIWADAGYTGELVYGRAYFGHWLLDLIRRCDKGFKVLPRR